MAEKNDLKHLNRSELLELLIAQTKKTERLQAQLDAANEKLNNEKIAIEKAGSIAEAALQINGVYDAAQKAADQYIVNTKRICRETIARARQQTNHDFLEIDLCGHNHHTHSLLRIS